jgi:hypothetical protein
MLRANAEHANGKSGRRAASRSIQDNSKNPAKRYECYILGGIRPIFF